MKDGLCEGEVGHVGVAPWAIDNEEVDGGDGEAIYVAVGIGDLLGSLLANSEEGGRAVILDIYLRSQYG